MNIIQPYAKILAPFYSREDGITGLQFVELVGRVSHRSEEAQTETSWEKFLTANVLGHGDWSITEHVYVTVEAVVDRGITHEWVRHRIGAYTQESTRFVNYKKKMLPSFVFPSTDIRERYEDGSETSGAAVWKTAIEGLEGAYQQLVGMGFSPQIARSVFPNALASKLIVTYNLRNWRHFFLMRTSKEAHPQMREVTIPLLAEFKSIIPLLYDDIQPNMRQIDNMRLPR